jgi:hypothetical protein
LSAATAPATSVASDNRSKSFRVGARRFTQSGHASVHFDPLTRINNRSSFHGRRYSNAVREPSAAAASISSSNAGDAFEEDDHARDPKKLAKHDTQMLLVSFNSLLGRDGGGRAVENLMAFVLRGGLSQVLQEVTGQSCVLCHFISKIEISSLTNRTFTTDFRASEASASRRVDSASCIC